MSEFPIDSMIDGRFRVTERIHGDIGYGVYRAEATAQAQPAGQEPGNTETFLATLIATAESADVLAARLPCGGAELEGVFELKAIGTTYVVLLEKEPNGTPSDRVSTMQPAEAFALAIEVINEVERFYIDAEQRIGVSNAPCLAIHPAMVFVRPDRKLAGIALRWHLLREAALPASIGGILPFTDVLSPEQVSGVFEIRASDSALIIQCLVLWLTGESAYVPTSNQLELMMAVSNGMRRPIDVPDSVRALIDSGLSIEPSNRPTLSQIRVQLRKALADEIGPSIQSETPIEIPRSEFRDLVFYALESETSEPTPGTPSIVLEDFRFGAGKRLPLSPDFAPYITLLDREFVEGQLVKAVKAAKPESPELVALSKALEWLQQRPEGWFGYQLEPKELSGTGRARAILIAREKQR